MGIRFFTAAAIALLISACGQNETARRADDAVMSTADTLTRSASQGSIRHWAEPLLYPPQIRARDITKVGVSAMPLTTVQRILELCDQLSEDDREILEERLAQRAEAAWRGEVEDARRQAEERGIDQDAIDQAIHKHRHGA